MDVNYTPEQDEFRTEVRSFLAENLPESISRKVRLLEENLRRSLMISRGSWTIFLERPISAVLIILSLILVTMPILKWCLSKVR